MARHSGPLDLFDPLVSAWFTGRFGEPTEVQRLAWPRIADGEHVLLTAPTGAGKTLAAFLWAVDKLLSGAWPGGAVRVLYVSPLKALNSDVRRNLLVPLDELSARFRAAGREPPELRVLTRSGDTPQEDRERMARRPPEILITTPESLNILLTSRRGRTMLGGLATVILDEVHAVVGSKRGVHLITAVERLVRLSGEFQRVALSATVRPLERVAEWVGGYTQGGEDRATGGRRRPVRVVAASATKAMELRVRYPGAVVSGGGDGDDVATPDELWSAVVGGVRSIVERARSTLVFANSRRMVEKLTRLVNEDAGGELVYSHHGSLAREVRTVVEERLKRGELAGIVATNSLELGIDVGALDHVVLVQTPPSVSSAVQRVGRSGHTVGQTSRGTFVSLVPRDLVASAVMSREVLDGAIEPVRPVTGALDVLAQVVVSMCCGEVWQLDDLFEEVRRSSPYRALPRRAFDLVLEMLAGRYLATRVRELRPLLSIDRLDETVTARPGAERTIFLAGGTIPDRGYFHLRVADSGALLGELDEEFVWERSIGDTFTLGVRSWRIDRITHNDVFVRPTPHRAAMAPFWRAEEQSRTFELSERIGTFLEEAQTVLGERSFIERLVSRHGLDASSAAALVGYLSRQMTSTRVLPHRHRLVIERVVEPQGKESAPQIILHTLWGGRVNRPYAMALSAAWEERHGVPLEVNHDDDCLIVTSSSAEIDSGKLVSLVTAENVERLLRSRLERTGFFGARFREAAGRALLLPREGFHRRTPLWLSRQRAKELLDAVGSFDDFPIVLETWRTCLVEEFDLEALRRLLDELREGTIEVAAVTTDHPSPFAAGVAWKRTNELMYEDDTPQGGRLRMRADLVRELVFASELRPLIRRSLADELEAKLRRVHPGYAPRDARELLDWVVERVAVPVDQWHGLLAAVERDTGSDPRLLVKELSAKLVAVAPRAGVRPTFVAAVENVPRLASAMEAPPVLSSASLDGLPAPAVATAGTAVPDSEEGEPLAELLADVLRFSGPVASGGALEEVFGVGEERARDALSHLVDSQRAVVGELVHGEPGPLVCDADNFERLLRMGRAAARPEFEPLALERLPLFLARWQGLATEGANGADLRSALERLFGFAAPVELWESDIFPARLDPYEPAWLDTLMRETELLWLGAGKGRATFLLASDRELAAETGEAAADDGDEAELPARAAADEANAIFPHPKGTFAFEELVAHSHAASAEVAARLWRLAWDGKASTDTFEPVRKGIATGFKPATADRRAAHPGRPVRRFGFDRWQASRPFSGRWFPLAPSPSPADALEAEERAKDRARLLLDRYGVVFRELLEREAPASRWGKVFRALRLMELSGEVVGGQFFLGPVGLQFASPDALRLLRDGLREDRTWWMNACDPASPCGLAVAGLPAQLPRRVPSSHVVFHGSQLVVSSERNGRDLAIAVSPDHPLLPSYLTFMKILLARPARPLRALVVEEINGEPAAASPFRQVLTALFHTVRDRTALRLSRRY